VSLKTELEDNPYFHSLKSWTALHPEHAEIWLYQRNEPPNGSVETAKAKRRRFGSHRGEQIKELELWVRVNAVKKLSIWSRKQQSKFMEGDIKRIDAELSELQSEREQEKATQIT